MLRLRGVRISGLDGCLSVTAERRPEAATEWSQGLAVVEWSPSVAAARRQPVAAERSHGAIVEKFLSQVV